MTGNVFVDTNVLVYARDADEHTKQPVAMDWLARLWRDRTGRTSVQVLSEYYVTVTRKLQPGLKLEHAWDDVLALGAWRPQAIDLPLIRRGREIERRHRLSWWDSLVVAAAQMQSCAVLLSEDLQDGAIFGGVSVRNPFRPVAAEARAPYGALSKAVPRHRRPGRPPRAKI